MEKQRHQAIPRTLNLVWNEKGELLMLEYSKKKGKMAGWFNCPGGHVEHGEGIIESGKREVLEETGVVVENMSLRGVVHVSNFFGKDILMFATEASVKNPQVAASEEGDLEWMAPTRLDDIRTFADLRLIIDKLEEMDKGEVFVAKSEFDDEGNLVRFEFED